MRQERARHWAAVGLGMSGVKSRYPGGPSWHRSSLVSIGIWSTLDRVGSHRSGGESQAGRGPGPDQLLRENTFHLLGRDLHLRGAPWLLCERLSCTSPAPTTPPGVERDILGKLGAFSRSLQGLPANTHVTHQPRSKRNEVAMSLPTALRLKVAP